jgi:hypothetical protein
MLTDILSELLKFLAKLIIGFIFGAALFYFLLISNQDTNSWLLFHLSTLLS